MSAGVDMVPEVHCHCVAIAGDHDAVLFFGPLEYVGVVHAQRQIRPITDSESQNRHGTWFCVVSLDRVPEWTAQVFIKQESAWRVHGADSGAIALSLFLSSERPSPAGVVARC